MTTLAAALLKGVPRYMKIGEDIFADEDGAWLLQDEVLAALTAALDGVDERAVEAVEALRGEPTWSGLVSTAKEAADLITALLAQNAALRADKEALHLALGEASKTIVETKAERDALRAERDDWAWRYQEGCDTYNVMHFKLEAAEAVAEKLRGALQIAKSIFDTPIGLRRLGIDPNTDERLIEFRALTTETDNG